MEVKSSRRNVHHEAEINSEYALPDQIDLQYGQSRANFLQKVTNIKTFIIIQGLLGLSESTIVSYVSGIISAIEKRFKLTSTASGVIVSSYDFGASISIIFVSYFGSDGHKPRWIAIFTALSGISCIAMYLPQLIFGPGTIESKGNEGLCISKVETGKSCVLDYQGEISWAIFCLAYTVIGGGMCCYYTIGATYFDDNVSHQNFPFLYALIMFITSVGPTIGYLISSYALSFYIDPDLEPDFANDDPRWIGAWYKAWVYIGSFQILLALAVAIFPKVIRVSEIQSNNDTTSQINELSLKDFTEKIMRLIKNPILMLKSINYTAYQFGVLGMMTFLPKYIETQYRYSATVASLYTGYIRLASSTIGVLIIGSLITRYKPSARFIVVWNIFTEIVYAAGIISFIFIGCYTNDLHGSYDINKNWDVKEKCNFNCGCTTAESFTPVCSIDKLTTYYSPCYAGCKSYKIINSTKLFLNCSCISGEKEAFDGACPVECNSKFYTFIIIFSIMSLLYSTGNFTNQIIKLRSVHERDKPMAIAIFQIMQQLLSNMPAPILYGKIIDSSCLVWGTNCGKKSNCTYYDGGKMRLLLSSTSAGFIIAAILLDVALWFKVGSLDIYGDEDHKDEENEDIIQNEITH